MLFASERVIKCVPRVTFSAQADSVASCPPGTVREGPGALWRMSSRPPEGRGNWPGQAVHCHSARAGPAGQCRSTRGRALPPGAPGRRAVPLRPSPGRARPLFTPPHPTPRGARPRRAGLQHSQGWFKVLAQQIFPKLGH